MKLNINGTSIEVSDEDISKALEEKQESFEVKAEDLVIKSTSDFDTYTDNLKQESQKLGMDLGRKDMFKTLGIEFEGTGAHRDNEKSVELIQTWKSGEVSSALESAQIAPDKKVKELTSDLDTMRNNYNTAQAEIEKAKNEFSSFRTNIEKRSVIEKSLPDNLAIPKDDMILILQSKVNIDKHESGKFVAFNADGTVMKDDNLQPLGAESAIKPFFENNPHYLKAPAGGAGGGDSSGASGKQTIEEFNKEMAELGHNQGSQQYTQIMTERIKSKTLDYGF
jgi:hypothetical protein